MQSRNVLEARYHKFRLLLQGAIDAIKVENLPQIPSNEPVLQEISKLLQHAFKNPIISVPISTSYQNFQQQPKGGTAFIQRKCSVLLASDIDSFDSFSRSTVSAHTLNYAALSPVAEPEAKSFLSKNEEKIIHPVENVFKTFELVEQQRHSGIVVPSPDLLCSSSDDESHSLKDFVVNDSNHVFFTGLFVRGPKHGDVYETQLYLRENMRHDAFFPL
uniref:Uncharacterized protein n=1 Tax=Onchocerca volvulus TaxID=6282 RepID=A0A8R1TLI7_ONCVO